MNNKIFAILFVILSLSVSDAMASHIVGGEMTYKYMGSTIAGNIYQFTLTIYEDCLNPRPGAIVGDNPAIIEAFDAVSLQRVMIDSSSVLSDSVPTNFSNACLTNPPQLCLLKKKFTFQDVLPPNPDGYIIAYQKCCRNGAIANIVDPANTGSTYYCNIPPIPLINNSAVFNNYPPQIICMNNPLDYDHSATDPDGDSLSYEFCNSLVGGEDQNIAPYPAPPPYDSVQWVNPPYYYTHPLTGSPPIQIDPVTGHITGTPVKAGRYLVTVCCHEWRFGRIINTTKREFQFVVTPCSKSVVACIPQYSSDINTYIIDCTDYTVHFVNCSTGGTTWFWNFGAPSAPGNTSTAFQPDFTYPDTGTYVVKLVANPGSTCADSINRFVKIYPKFRADFTDTGVKCANQQIGFTDLTSSTSKPINYWKWNFGDGDTSFLENPTHKYGFGGNYNVTLISANARNCADTAIRQVLIENFTPFAGHDTIIVKGEEITFNATGGTEYTWSPPQYLSDTTIYNPVGFYPDTGRFIYNVHIRSAFGCSGYDTIQVTVVGQAEFFVPNAFSPNGDGKNDIFRPFAVGYAGLVYFKVFNRWGQMVYNNNSLETGWDGTFNNTKCDMGTYYWEISFTDRYGKRGFLKGDVMLIR